MKLQLVCRTSQFALRRLHVFFLFINLCGHTHTHTAHCDGSGRQNSIEYYKSITQQNTIVKLHGNHPAAAPTMGAEGLKHPPKKISQIPPPKWTTTKFFRNCTSSHYYHRTQSECQRHRRLQVRILLTYFTTGNKIAIWHFHCQIWHFSVT